MHCFTARPHKLTGFFEFKGSRDLLPILGVVRDLQTLALHTEPGFKASLRMDVSLVHCSAQKPIWEWGQTAEFSNFWFLIFLSLPRNSLLCTDSPRDYRSALVWFPFLREAEATNEYVILAASCKDH